MAGRRGRATLRHSESEFPRLAPLRAVVVAPGAQLPGLREPGDANLLSFLLPSFHIKSLIDRARTGRSCRYNPQRPLLLVAVLPTTSPSSSTAGDQPPCLLLIYTCKFITLATCPPNVAHRPAALARALLSFPRSHANALLVVAWGDPLVAHRVRATTTRGTWCLPDVQTGSAATSAGLRSPPTPSTTFQEALYLPYGRQGPLAPACSAPFRCSRSPLPALSPQHRRPTFRDCRRHRRP